MAPERPDTRWAVDCGDAFGRLRVLRVRVEPGDVTLGFPPGESAALAGDQLAGLARVLRAAGHLATQEAAWGTGLSMMPARRPGRESGRG